MGKKLFTMFGPLTLIKNRGRQRWDFVRHHPTELGNVAPLISGQRPTVNGPQDRENQLFQGLWPSLGLKTAKAFQCAPLEGGTKGENEKKRENRSVFDETTFFDTTTKNSIFNLFFDFFFGSEF